MRARAIAAAVGLSTLAVATTYCGGDAFTAGPDDGGAVADGSASIVDSSTSADGSVTDAKTHDGHHDGAGQADGSLDATSLDAADASDAPTVFSCATPPSGTLFCDDFDHSASVGANWTVTLQFGQSANAFDTNAFVTSPNGYASTTQVLGDAAGAAGASLQKTGLSSTGATIEMGFNAKVKKLGAGSSFPIARLSFGLAELMLDLVLSDAGLTLEQHAKVDGSPTVRSDLAHAPEGSGWFHARLVLVKTAPAVVKVVFDDATMIQVPAIETPVDTTIEADVGIIAVIPPSEANAVTFDDVLVRAP